MYIGGVCIVFGRWIPVAVTVGMGRRTGVVLVVVLVLLVVFRAYVRIFATVGYTYFYWGVVPKRIQWIGAEREARGRAGELALPVPKLIHQTWVDEHVPEKWKDAQQSCIDAHATGNYTYKLWTDAEGLELIRDAYPWFLSTYEAYPYAIQRVDAVRYFILHKYGGIYIDLDMGCNRELSFMREYGFTAPLTYPIGISNDVMGAQPGNAYLERVIHRLQYWNHWLFIKYIQVMFSTGPMFLTGQYAVGGAGVRDVVGVVDGPLYGKYDSSGNAAFYHLHGSSWHADDAQFIFFLDRLRTHWVVALGIVGVGLAGWVWWSKWRGSWNWRMSSGQAGGKEDVERRRERREREVRRGEALVEMLPLVHRSPEQPDHKD